MRLLPPVVRPPETPIGRRHRPPRRSRWSDYRACLRWDFGFACPFCLLHEADWHLGVAGEGLGVTTVEHVMLKSLRPDLASDYENCVYACRLCNQARGRSPREIDGARLLAPTEDAWGDHFVVEDDEVRGASGDRDARYTEESYDLNDPRKVLRRRKRREFLEGRLVQAATIRERIDRLTRNAESLLAADDPRYEEDLLEAERLQVYLAEATWFEAVPRDAPEACLCDGPRTLPSWLEEQVVEI